MLGVMRLYDYLFGWKKWNIKKGDRVLELGSGGNPMVRSNILVDRYVDDDSERELNITKDRTLICADIANLPFKNGIFDFIYTSHAIEHLDDIEKSFGEMVRVGKKGVIIVPGEIYERTWDKDSHKWIITESDGKLIFRKKCACTSLNHNPILEKWKNIFWDVYSKNRDLLDIIFFWEEVIPFIIIECGDCYNAKKKPLSQRRPVHKKISFTAKTKVIAKIILARTIRAIYF